MFSSMMVLGLFLTSKLVNKIISEFIQGAEAVVPGIYVTDTIKMISNNHVTTLPREDLRLFRPRKDLPGG